MSESSGVGPEMEALRDEMRDVLQREGISLPDAAKLADVGYSTLVAWLGGKYAGDNARVAQKVRTWLSTLVAANDRRQTVLALPVFVPTASSAAFMDALEHAQTIPDLVTISGGAGVGKTSACLEYQRTHSSVWIVTARPSTSSTYAMLESLCSALAVREGSTSRRNAAIVRRVINTRGLLIVDEANHLSTTALDELRSIHDEARVGLALVGNEEVYSRLEGGGRRAEFAQLFSRIGLRLRRAKPLAADMNALADAAGVAGDDERRVLRAIAAKPGALRGAAKTLRIAQMLAHHDSTPLSVAHLNAAWARLSDSAPVGEAV